MGFELAYVTLMESSSSPLPVHVNVAPIHKNLVLCLPT